MSIAGRRTRDVGKRALHRMFVTGQRLGVDVLPRHFYSAVPDIAALSRTETWRTPRTLVGLSGFDADAQLASLGEWFSADVRSALAGRDLQAEAAVENGAVGYGRTEATVLYAFTASVRPRRVVQIGAGAATAVMLAAGDEHGTVPQIHAIDPFPTDYLVSLADRGRITLTREPAQEVALDALTALESGDLLFVDSTHTVKPGSEVNRIVLEVLPRLAPGVWVHFHDIWFPFDYPPDLLDAAMFFWNESVLLHAYLTDNDRVTTRVGLSWLHHVASDRLERVVPGHRPAVLADGLAASPGDFPSAIYLRVER